MAGYKKTGAEKALNKKILNREAFNKEAFNKEAFNKRHNYALIGFMARFLCVITLFLVIFAQGSAYFGWQIPISAKNREEFIKDQIYSVSQTENSLFANLRVEAQNGVSLPSAYILINGLKAGDFASGSLLLRVYEGDYLEIDCSAYARAINFKITGISANLKRETLPQTITVKNSLGEIGIIRFK